MEAIMEVNQPSLFVLEVATLGNAVVAAFSKFITSGKVHDKRLETLFSNVSITASLLLQLGTTLKQHENETLIKVDITRPTCQLCKADLEKLQVVLQEAHENGNWVIGGMLGGKAMSAAVDPFYLFNVALGGREAAEELNTRMSDTRMGLLRLIDAVRYTILKRLDQENRLNPEQTEELRNLRVILPQLVRGIEKSKKAERERLAAAEIERTVKSSRNRPDVGMVSSLERRDSDAASEVTLFGAEQGLKAKGIHFAKEDDNESLYSIDSDGDALQVRLRVTDEVYEEWSLRWSEPEKDTRKSWGLFGIKLKENYYSEGFWYVDPEMRSQDEMKEQHELAQADLSTEKHQTAMAKAVRAIPEDGGELIDRLIEDREDATSTWKVKRKWTVVAVRAVKKNPYSGSKKWGKKAKETDWYVVIRGTTIDQVKRIRPDRRGDPWFKPSRRRYRSPSPVRYIERRPVPEYREFRQPIVVDEYPRIPTGPAGRLNGPLVVGQVPSQQEAEEKMEEMAAEMTI